ARGPVRVLAGRCGPATPGLRPRAGQVRFNPPSRGSILSVNSLINADEANDTDRMVPAENCIWLENRPGLHHIWPGADDRLCPVIMAACTNPKAERKSVVPVSRFLRRSVSAFLFTKRQPRPRGMSSLPAICVAAFSGGCRCRQ